MKLLLTALKRTHGPAVHICRSSHARSGPLALRGQHELMVGSSRELVQKLGSQVEVRTGFITEEEEAALLQELEPGLKKKRYEFDHWDDAIHGYRETERLRWGPACEQILNRVRAAAFPEGSSLLGPVHVLDLDKTGYIKPHVDSVKFCGSTIAGLSLLSDSIMRLVKEDNPGEWLDVLLSQRSLYIMRHRTRPGITSLMRFSKMKSLCSTGKEFLVSGGSPSSVVTFQPDALRQFQQSASTQQSCKFTTMV